MHAQAEVKFIDLSTKKEWNFVVLLNIHMYKRKSVALISSENR